MHEPRYDSAAVRSLFDEMAATYGIVNVISSFGFCHRWRRQCVAHADIRPGMTVYDLMCGMGECWPFIARRLQNDGRIVGVDFSREMCRRARSNALRLLPLSAGVREEDVLNAALPDGDADAVVGCFALKTLDDQGLAAFANQIARLLRPGGTFAVLEISRPASWLRVPYMFYLHHLIPLIGRLLLGNPDNYRMLGLYTSAFVNCTRVAAGFSAAGLAVSSRNVFMGCASLLHGSRPKSA